MQRAAVVESDATMTRQALRDVGFDDNQAQALVDLSGTAAERRELRTDVTTLKTDVTTLKTDVVDLQQGLATFRTETRGEFARLDARVDGLRDEMNARFDGLRDEMNARFGGVDARFKGLEDRMDARFDGVDARFDGMENRMKLMLWIMGIGAAVYTGTSASLLVLLYRVVVV